MDAAGQYYQRYAAAYVRGMAKNAAAAGSRTVSPEQSGRQLALDARLMDAPLDGLTPAELQALIGLGRQAGLKLYRFKRTHDELPRVKSVLGFLRAVQPQSLLDVGSGRGAFLWPCLNALPALQATSIDLLPHRVELLRTVALGGADNVRAVCADLCTWDAPNGSYDVVTLLEVLEHIPDTASAISNAVRLAQRYVVLSVPSKPDDNPEHIHLFTRDSLTKLFTAAGCTHLRFDGVPGHIIMTAAKEENP